MYASHHAAIGTPLAVLGYLSGDPVIFGASLVGAFLTHHLLDMVGERAYGPLVSKETLLWEGLPLVAFAVAAYLSGIPWVFAAGWLASLGMDLIDKPFNWIRKARGLPYKAIFPCHKSGFVKWPLTLTQTKVTAILSAISYLLLAMVL